MAEMENYENWGYFGMPPIMVKVLCTKVVRRDGDVTRLMSWLEGSHPHLGNLINGWRGRETVVERLIRPYQGGVVPGGWIQDQYGNLTRLIR